MNKFGHAYIRQINQSARKRGVILKLNHSQIFERCMRLRIEMMNYELVSPAELEQVARATLIEDFLKKTYV